MNYDDRIAFLQQLHNQLKKEVRSAVANKEDSSVIAELKKNKLHVKDSLDKLTSLHVNEGVLK